MKELSILCNISTVCLKLSVKDLSKALAQADIALFYLAWDITSHVSDLTDEWKTVWNIRPEVHLDFFSSSSVAWMWRCKALLTSLWITTNGEVHSKYSEAWLPFRGACTGSMRELAETLWNEADNLVLSLGRTNSGHWYILSSHW